MVQGPPLQGRGCQARQSTVAFTSIGCYRCPERRATRKARHAQRCTVHKNTVHGNTGAAQPIMGLKRNTPLGFGSELAGPLHRHCRSGPAPSCTNESPACPLQCPRCPPCAAHCERKCHVPTHGDVCPVPKINAHMESSSTCTALSKMIGQMEWLIAPERPYRLAWSTCAGWGCGICALCPPCPRDGQIVWTRCICPLYFRCIPCSAISTALWGQSVPMPLVFHRHEPTHEVNGSQMVSQTTRNRRDLANHRKRTQKPVILARINDLGPSLMRSQKNTMHMPSVSWTSPVWTINQRWSCLRGTEGGGGSQADLMLRSRTAPGQVHIHAVPCGVQSP